MLLGITPQARSLLSMGLHSLPGDLPLDPAG